MKCLLLGLAGVALLATPSSAQESIRSTLVGIEAGDPVRVTYHIPHTRNDHRATLAGQYASLDPGELRLWISQPGGVAARTIARQDLVRVERPRRRTLGEGSGRGALYGTIAGAVFGALLVTATGEDQGMEVWFAAALFSAAGAGAGAAVGMGMRGTTWEEIPLPIHEKPLPMHETRRVP
jgi:hypothetical protein